MSNYPCGVAAPQETWLEYECYNCAHDWHVTAIDDLGMCDPVDVNDTQCPVCGSWKTDAT